MERKLIDIVYKTIVDLNKKDSHDSIPQTDILYKNFIAIQGIGKSAMLSIIDILKKSHKILSIEIAKENKSQNVDKIEGYVDADLSTIQRLKLFYENALIEQYEQYYRVKMGVHQIMKVIFPKLAQLNNTPLGYIANKAIMLGEYEKLLNKYYYEYSETWKEERLSQLLNGVGSSKIKSNNKKGFENDKDNNRDSQKGKINRAVDSDSYKNYSDDKERYPVDKLLNIYGSIFFFRVCLRKYEFALLCNIIEDGIINSKSDLKSLKGMIDKMKLNYEKDTRLADYSREIKRLEQIVSKKIIFSKR